MKNMKWKNLAIALLASVLIYGGGTGLINFLHGGLIGLGFDSLKVQLVRDILRLGLSWLHSLPIALWVYHRAKESIGNPCIWLFAVMLSNLVSLTVFIGALILESLTNISHADCNKIKSQNQSSEPT